MGQAFRLGRYAIHFHLSGSMSGSYIRNCAIHHSHNRALTAHGVHDIVIEGNVAYDIRGHTFFVVSVSSSSSGSPCIVSPLSHHCLAIVSPLSHYCLTIVSHCLSLSHYCLTIVSYLLSRTIAHCRRMVLSPTTCTDTILEFSLDPPPLFSTQISYQQPSGSQTLKTTLLTMLLSLQEHMGFGE